MAQILRKYNWFYCRMHNIKLWRPVNIYDLADIGDDVSVGMYTEIGKNVKIGSGTRIGFNCFLPEGLTIGKNCFIGPKFCGSNDFYPPSPKSEWRKTVIEDNVSIGANVSIRPGITVKSGSLIGMGTVLTHDIPENEIWCGNPGKKLRKNGRK